MRGEIRRFNILFVVRITKCGLGHLLGPYLYMYADLGTWFCMLLVRLRGTGDAFNSLELWRRIKAEPTWLANKS